MERRDFVVIKATVSKYDRLFDFHEDMGMVLYDGKFGFINKEGEEVVKTIYDDVKDYNNGYAAVKKNNKWFFINKKGFKVSQEYDFVYSFKDNYAIVEKDNKWGVVDRDFKEVVPLIYDSIDSIGDGLIAVSRNGEKKYIDHNNEEKIKLPNYVKRAYQFKNGIARLESENNATGYIDKEGRQVTGFVYGLGSDFDRGLAIVSQKDGTTLINKKGEELFPRTRKFNIFASALANGNFTVSLGYKKYALINQLGELVTEKTYENMYYESDGLIRVQDEKRDYGFIDINGQEIIPTVLEFADDFSEGLTVVQDSLTKKYGYMDKNGILVIPYMYDRARSYSNGMAIVEIAGNCFYIDKNNKPLKTMETKKKQIKVEAPGIIPIYVQKYDMNEDFLRYRTELSISDQWMPKVVETCDINQVNEHEEKVLKLEADMLESMQELTKPKKLVK